MMTETKPFEYDEPAVVLGTLECPIEYKDDSLLRLAQNDSTEHVDPMNDEGIQKKFRPRDLNQVFNLDWRY